MQKSFSNSLKIVLYLLIVFAIGFLYFILDKYTKSFFAELLWSGYAFIFIDWGISVKRRFTNKKIVKYLTASCYMAVLLLFLNFFKYSFINENDYINGLYRCFWYLYYIPILLMPQFMFFAALYVGKTEDEAISKRWNLLYILSALLITAVLTNDYHNLVFRLHNGENGWNGDYSYGVLYYLIFTVICLYILSLLFLIIKQYSNRRFIKRMWLSGLVVAFGLVYLAFYIRGFLGYRNVLKIVIPLPVFFCLATMMYWESILTVHLLPSNGNHEKFFMSSSLRAGICDESFKTALVSAKGEVYSRKVLENACASPVSIEDNTLLKNTKISGGYFYYTEDITEINALNNELIEKENYLEEENAVLQASNQLEEDRKRYTEQNLIYDKIAKNVKPQCDKIEQLLSDSKSDEKAFELSLKQIGILGAYIKRCGNMLLLSAEENELLDTEELKYAVDESVKYSTLAGIKASADIPSGIMLPCEQLLFIYGLFEEALEAALPLLSQYEFVLGFEEDCGEFRLTLNSPASVLPNDYKDKAVRIDVNGDTEVVSFRFLTGGDGI